jgi:hypothetical protein
MDRNAKLLFSLLKRSGATKGMIEGAVMDGTMDYIDNRIDIPGGHIPLLSPLDQYVESLIDNMASKITNQYIDVGSPTGYVRVYFNIDTEEEIFKIETDVQYYGESSSGAYYDLKEEKPGWMEEIKTYFKEIGKPKYVIIGYDGGGDDGYLRDMGESNIGEVKVSKEIEQMCYTILSVKFPGWEINEGSSGEIIINKKEIEVNHLWVTEEYIEGKTFYIDPKEEN